MSQPSSSPAANRAATPPGPATKALLACGPIAAVLFIVVALAQAATRTGFDLLRHPVSALSNGDLGWVQSANFLVSGLLMLACAAGMGRVLRGLPVGTWTPRLLGVYGVGFVAAGFLPADPVSGFPPGTGDTVPITGTGIAHLAAGSVAFLALIAACFVLARLFTATGQRGRATASRVIGALFAVCVVWSSSGAPGGSLALFLGDAVAWIWVAAFAAQLASRRTPAFHLAGT